MTTRIAYSSTNSRTGQQIASFVNDTMVLLANGRRLQAKLNSMSSGNDWTSLEGEIGGMTAGTGQTLWTILATAMAGIDTAATAELSRLDQT